MAWIYRVVEDDGGDWKCRFGLTEFDRHDTADAALSHIKDLAAMAECDDIRLHHLDGTIERHTLNQPPAGPD